MKQVEDFIIMPDDSVGRDTETVTTHLLLSDPPSKKTTYDDGEQWDVAVFERFCCQGLIDIAKIKLNNGGK